MAFGTDLLKNSVADRQKYYQEQIKIQDDDQVKDQEKQNQKQSEIGNFKNRKTVDEENQKTNQANSNEKKSSTGFNDDQNKSTKSRKVAFNKPEVVDKNNSSNSNDKNHDLTIQKAVAVIEELSKYQSADPQKLEHYIDKIKSNHDLAQKEYNRLSPKLEQFKKQSNNNNNTNDANNESNYITFNLMDLNGKTHKKKIDIQSNPEMVYYHNTVAKQVSTQNSPFSHLKWSRDNDYSDQNLNNHDYDNNNKKKQVIKP